MIGSIVGGSANKTSVRMLHIPVICHPWNVYMLEHGRVVYAHPSSNRKGNWELTEDGEEILKKYKGP